MTILYLDCSMGAAGDMLMGALYEICPQKEKFLEVMSTLFKCGITVSPKPDDKCGITGTHMNVLVNGHQEHESKMGHVDNGHSHHEHSHSTLADIYSIIDTMPIDEKVKQDAKNVYGIIASAESTVHGAPVEQVHFHEVGALDAVADVTGVCLLMHMLHPDRVCASPVNLGNGQVRCAHGLMPVPAPATALILRGVACYAGTINGELCTPTGAALLKYFVNDFGPMPCMTPEAIGCGTGTKDFELPNCIRVFMGHTQEDDDSKICCVECNLDDMTPEAIGFAMDVLLENGALDVYTTPIGMKKNRPAVMLTCLCEQKDEKKFASLMLRHTTTLGVRIGNFHRIIMQRREQRVSTPLGSVRVKYSNFDAIEKAKPEYDDVRSIAIEKTMSFSQVYEEISKYI